MLEPQETWLADPHLHMRMFELTQLAEEQRGKGQKTNTLRLLLFSCVFGITGRLPIICFTLLKAPKPHWFFLTRSESLGVLCYLCASLALDSEEALGDTAGEGTGPWLWIKESRV